TANAIQPTFNISSNLVPAKGSQNLYIPPSLANMNKNQITDIGLDNPFDKPTPIITDDILEENAKMSDPYYQEPSMYQNFKNNLQSLFKPKPNLLPTPPPPQYFEV
ncbi:MAG: hypothetical protein LBR24_03830, partial [Methanobrevibacter sp.]|nr:hypothetical protein [Methanobrevibacter sp.]